MEWAYSGFGTSKICLILTYLDTRILTAPDPHIVITITVEQTNYL